MKYLIVMVLFVLVVGIFRALMRASNARKSGKGASSGDGGATYLAAPSHTPPAHGHHSHDSSHGDGGGGDGGGDGGGGGD